MPRVFANAQGGGEEKGMFLILESAPDDFIWVFWLISITKKKLWGLVLMNHFKNWLCSTHAQGYGAHR